MNNSTDWEGRSYVVYTLLRLLVTFIVRVGLIRLSVEGSENCPLSGPVFLQ